jgi:hypothetical protein
LNSNLIWNNNKEKRLIISLDLFHPHPASPVHALGGSSTRGRSLDSLPWREGLREGDKMAIAFIWAIGPIFFHRVSSIH